uniref:Replicative DNA helicase n=1 Tax=Siphoviridae sp. ctiOl67 TaxID=2825622 RepID=A0A8S5QJG3_9CAUD|nr:MAG TPA: replicative DNA helicase [Siphoviridae sp. ctiOl67]
MDQITWLSSGQYFGNNETAEFAAISKQLREAQLELKIPFICLHQLNRSAYLNSDLSDGLYGSDKLKQDCSMIICIKDSTDENGNLFLDFTMSKNRSGCKDSTLKYQVNYDTGVFKCVSAEVPDAN